MIARDEHTPRETHGAIGLTQADDGLSLTVA